MDIIGRHEWKNMFSKNWADPKRKNTLIILLEPWGVTPIPTGINFVNLRFAMYALLETNSKNAWKIDSR